MTMTEQKPKIRYKLSVKYLATGAPQTDGTVEWEGDPAEMGLYQFLDLQADYQTEVNRRYPPPTPPDPVA